MKALIIKNKIRFERKEQYTKWPGKEKIQGKTV